jgi:hypothetical protein
MVEVVDEMVEVVVGLLVDDELEDIQVKEEMQHLMDQHQQEVEVLVLGVTTLLPGELVEEEELVYMVKVPVGQHDQILGQLITEVQEEPEDQVEQMVVMENFHGEMEHVLVEILDDEVEVLDHLLDEVLEERELFV